MLNTITILIWIAVVTAAVSLTNARRVVLQYGKREYRYPKAAAWAMAIPIIIWAGTRGYVADTSLYRIGFQNAADSIFAIPGYLSAQPQDPGYGVFQIALKSVIGNHDVVYFTIIAAICALCVILTYQKYSCSLPLSVFLFVASSDCYQWLFNGMRQFIPAAVLFAAMGFLLKKRYAAFVILTLIGATFHLSALLLIPAAFLVQGKAWNRKTLLFFAAIAVSILFLEQFTDLLERALSNTQYDDVVSQFARDDGTNILRVLVYAVPVLLSLVGKRQIDRYDSPIINLCVNMSILSLGIYILSMFTSGIYVGRIPVFFSLYNYILLPWEIEALFDRRSANLIRILMICFYMAFCYYQMTISWGVSLY